MKLFHTKYDHWEVVDHKTVDPMPSYNASELDKMNVVEACDSTMGSVCVFELNKMPDVRGAVAFARQKLLQEAGAKGYNAFLMEGWKVTHLRKGKQHRAEVRYWARPAIITPTPSQRRSPPFLVILEGWPRI